MTAQDASLPAPTDLPAAAFRLRTATPEDGAVIAELVRELAEYEREPQAATATGADFAQALQPGTGVGCLLAEVESAHGPRVAGMALWYTTFSTWQGRAGMWLEDLFVRPEHRRLGIGRAFFGALARECAARGFGRLEWWVLDWNTPAHAFYQQVGARPEDEWTVWRLDGDALATLES
jgi:GNAT superfamily N-acetyltransferase